MCCPLVAPVSRNFSALWTQSPFTHLPDTRSTLYILSSFFLRHPVSLDWCCSRSKECWEEAASRAQLGHSLEPCRLPAQPLQCLLMLWELQALCRGWPWWHSSCPVPFITTSSMLSFSWSDSIGLSPEIVYTRGFGPSLGIFSARSSEKLLSNLPSEMTESLRLFWAACCISGESSCPI